MKIVDLKCPSCGGKLIPMEGNPKIVVCEYCNSQFMLEEDQTINYHIHQYGPGTQMPGTQIPGMQMPGNGAGIRPAPPSKPAETKKGSSNLGAAVISAAVILFLAAFMTFFYVSGTGGKKNPEHVQSADSSHSGSGGGKGHGADSEIENPAETVTEHSPLWNAMVEEMFGKSPDLVTEEELASIKYISVREGADSAVVEYSFSDPYSDHDLSMESNLKNMGNLKNLSIHGCNVDEIEALSALTNLESLTCYSVWTYSVPLRNVGFLDRMTGLKYLDFSGKGADGGMGGYGMNMEILGDISNVFNHPSLEEVYLNNCMFEIDFDALKENEVLKVLEMKEISLKENFHVQSSSGMTDIWYDDVVFDSHTDFLTHFSNLEKLYLDGNQLTNIQFVSSLKHLTHLGIHNNYVTDLTPLNQVEHLAYLDISQNPVSGTVAAGDDVEVVR